MMMMLPCTGDQNSAGSGKDRAVQGLVRLWLENLPEGRAACVISWLFAKHSWYHPICRYWPHYLWGMLFLSYSRLLDLCQDFAAFAI